MLRSMKRPDPKNPIKKEITYKHQPAGNIKQTGYDDIDLDESNPGPIGEQYMLKRTVTPYKSKRKIRKFTEAPTDPRQVNFLSNYAGGLGEPLNKSFKYPTSVPYEGKKSWNIDRFLIDPQFSSGYEDLNQEDRLNKRELKNNTLADMYKYFMLQNKGDREKSWKEAKNFMKEEVNKRTKTPMYNLLVGKKHNPVFKSINNAVEKDYLKRFNEIKEDSKKDWGMLPETDANDNVLLDSSGGVKMRSRMPSVSQKFKKNPISKRFAIRSGMSWLMNSKGLSRKEAKKYLKDSENPEN